jgi:flagellar basal body-associated protein FliL
MHKRNRLTVLLTLPVVVFLWVIGWSLYWIGSKSREVDQKKKRKSFSLKESSIAVLTPEQEYAK